MDMHGCFNSSHMIKCAFMHPLKSNRSLTRGLLCTSRIIDRICTARSSLEQAGPSPTGMRVTCEKKAFHTSISRALICTIPLHQCIKCKNTCHTQGSTSQLFALCIMLAECGFQALVALFFLGSILKQSTLPDMAATIHTCL